MQGLFCALNQDLIARQLIEKPALGLMGTLDRREHHYRGLPRREFRGAATPAGNDRLGFKEALEGFR